eukprot:CAMPEP_0197047128 /NCGR_PEP_ID=MMETSP1384-20130603/22676_1 /TAXON_ID=29189 /ORGANISM="Ammonia sp." /LENGTH=284 /DNA_ID=CAMNT_0042479001 /DNA_START=22 /DNA_END=876 /DNA_ORIENTATION=-
MTTAYRQSNYLIQDNQHDSVKVSVYFQVSKKDIVTPSFKRKLRSIKNSVHKYDCGQILVRELTSDTNVLPKKSQMKELAAYLSKYEGTVDTPTFHILWKRLTDYHTLRHVEKSLLVIQFLLDQKPPLYSVAFEEFCKQQKTQFVKLSNYYYKVDGSDIGQNVRIRARDVYSKLFHEQLDQQSLGFSVFEDEDEQIGKQESKEREESDLNKEESIDLAATTPIASAANTKNNSSKGAADIFDIFGELPPTEEQQTNDTGNSANNRNNETGQNDEQCFDDFLGLGQ